MILARSVEALGDSHRAYSHVAPVAGLALSIVVLWGVFSRLESLPMGHLRRHRGGIR
jgi:hypothetical protein